MSFDLKLENGDLAINPNGTLGIVVNEVKLVQDVLKMIFSPTGSSSAHPWYGSTLSTKTIGKALPPELLVSEIQDSISTALNNLKTLQSIQERGGQTVSATEAIAKIEEISVSSDPGDARRVVISISIKTRSGNIVRDSFSLGI